METKAGIDILLLEEESKHGEREQEVELQHGIVQPVSGVLIYCTWDTASSLRVWLRDQ